MDGQTPKAEQYENSWIFLEEAFVKGSPSRKFMTVEQEVVTRLSIQDFILRLGTGLKVDYYTIYAATLYLNRLYMRIPITTSKYFVASAAMAISTKLYDTYRQPDKIALAASRIKSGGNEVTETSDVFWKWRDQLIYREELLLKLLNFELNIDFPYEIRDQLLQYESTSTAFDDKKAEILKRTVATIELLSALPILTTYDISTIFVAVLAYSTTSAVKKFNSDEFSKLPKLYISDNFTVDIKLCYKCHNFIVSLLTCIDRKNPRSASLAAIIDTFAALSEDEFIEIIN